MSREISPWSFLNVLFRQGVVKRYINVYIKVNIGPSIWNLWLLLWIYSSQNYPSLQIQHMFSCILRKDHFLFRKNYKIYEKWNESCEWSGTGIILFGNISFKIPLYNIIRVIIFRKESCLFMLPITAMLSIASGLLFFFFSVKSRKCIFPPLFCWKCVICENVSK